jgi:hypothetical protein
VKFVKKYKDTIDVELYTMENDEEPWEVGGYALLVVNSVPYGVVSLECDNDSIIKYLKEAMEIVAPQILEDAEQELLPSEPVSENNELDIAGE